MFRIGEFSKLAQVSGRLLSYYDELGLFSPEHTDPQSGYRYYSAQQLPHTGESPEWGVIHGLGAAKPDSGMERALAAQHL